MTCCLMLALVLMLWGLQPHVRSSLEDAFVLPVSFVSCSDLRSSLPAAALTSANCSCLCAAACVAVSSSETAEREESRRKALDPEIAS